MHAGAPCVQVDAGPDSRLHLKSLFQLLYCREQDLVEPLSIPAGQSVDVVLKKSFNAWRTYARQDVALAAVALALLYFTVLSFVSIHLGDCTLPRATCFFGSLLHFTSGSIEPPDLSGSVWICCRGDVRVCSVQSGSVDDSVSKVAWLARDHSEHVSRSWGCERHCFNSDLPSAAE